MPKPPNLIPSKQLNVALPLPIFTRLTLDLHSALEDRVPHGAYSRFLSDLLRAHYEESQLDLGPFLGADFPAGVYVIRGARETLEALQRKLS